MSARPVFSPCRVLAFVGLVCCHAAPAGAITLTFPGKATPLASLSDALTSYAVPIGPWADGFVPARIVEGPLTQTAWRINAPGLTTLQLLAPLREQLAAAGYEIFFDCETDACGGYDFRYSTLVLPEPDMHVDLGDFRFLAAERDGPSGPQIISLLVSRSTDTGFVQMISVGDAPLPAISIASSGTPASIALSPDAGGLGPQLLTGGVAALDDLIFETGSAKLGSAEFPSLNALAALLRAHPARRVALVGHTDASGALAGNIALSKARAASVRDRLIDKFGIPPDQVAAEGVGYLAPRATNLTSEGRARNRRVEVIVTSTQ